MTDTQTPLERAVEAARRALLDDEETNAYMRGDDPADSFLVDGHIRLTPVVRAVFMAMREPSEAMAKASKIVTTLPDGTRVTTWGSNTLPAMIDAALAE